MSPNSIPTTSRSNFESRTGIRRGSNNRKRRSGGSSLAPDERRTFLSGPPRAPTLPTRVVRKKRTLIASLSQQEPPMPSRDETLATRLDLVERRTRYLFEEYREQKREIDLRELQELSESPSKFFSKEEIDKRSQVRRELDITIKERVGELSLAITALDKLHPDHTPVP